MPITALKHWPGDGVIASVHTSREAADARSLPIPVVNISGALRDAGLPRVTNDQRAIGQAAAEHLLSRGLWQFAYYGVKNVWYSQERYRGFAQRLAEAGHQVQLWQASSSFGRKTGWLGWLKQIEHWLRDIEPPLGIMAVHDNRARMLMNVCHEFGLRIPHDVAVIGVNDAPMACEFGRPTLTSIGLKGERRGYLAAALLDRLMSGMQPPREDIVLSPGPVAERESTDLLAVADQDLRQAVRFMREYYPRGINVDSVLSHVTISRRSLEQRFQQYFDCTPHEFLCKTRVDRAKQLLKSQTRMSLGQVARACGFSNRRHLRHVFQRVTGSTPREYAQAEGELTRV